MSSPPGTAISHGAKRYFSRLNFFLLKLLTGIPFFIFMFAAAFTLQAQDTLKWESKAMQEDSVKEHSPLRAGIYSALLPGTGQIYNRKYWKVPLVYAALGTAVYFAYYNGEVFFTVKKNLDSRVAGDSTPEPQYLILNNIFSKTTIDLNQYTYDELLSVQDDYRRYYTISLIVCSGIYVLNILDAVVDAHLYRFDVSENLALGLEPRILSGINGWGAPGLSLSLHLK